MKITSVSYRQNKSNSADRYQTMHIEATVAVGPKDDPKKALNMAQDFVQHELGVVPMSRCSHCGGSTFRSFGVQR